MTIRDVEKRLKESAGNIKMKSFDERWEIIKERIQTELNSTDKTVQTNNEKKCNYLNVITEGELNA